MSDSSSSSDEEEKAKLKAATWSNFLVCDSKTDNKTPPQEKKKKSLRASLDGTDEQTDYRNVDATTEQKAFIAKKLTTWLDSSISVIKKSTTTSATQQDTDDDFQLFSTSKRGLSEVTYTPVRQRRRRQSSSDSDSEEERMKLVSVAVSYDQVIQSSWPPVSKDTQVTSNLLSTNLSTLTSAEDAAQTNKNKVDLSTCKEGKKKKKRKKKTSDATVEENDLPARSSAVEGKKVKASLKNENGTILESSRSEEQTIKKKKKKKDHNSATVEVT
ncbi:protein CUSTOS-like [Asterias rubens]|uniref:protein CUSTOS-like n=1 Tax=Asterias rubens TaxID=7604 RepID=UPI0014553D2C|nr:protein CUSTOS-like [Asterias rubens]